ncbi:MAG: bifunctional chorismate mutase/prephenate dehydrogenase [Acidobacteriota bacterium]
MNQENAGPGATASSTPGSEPDLAPVRQRLAEIDRELIRLAAERVRLSGEVAAIKRAAGRATVDYRQEKKVLERATSEARRQGLATEVAEDLVLRLIEASVTAQEEDNLRTAATGAGRIAVLVGGAGRMGRWMSRFLQAQGFATWAIDPAAHAEEDARGRELLPLADLVVCAAPPRVAVEWYRQWTEEPPRGLVVDIASIKTPLIEPIRRLQQAGARVASLHPMFGPSRTLLRGADVVICDTGDEEATDQVSALFAPTTAHRVRLPLDEHDRLMGDLLSLSHAAAIAFALALPEDDHPVKSTTFQAFEALASEVVRESPEVYFEIQADNPHSTVAVERLAQAVARIVEVVRARDAGAFTELMSEGRRHTRPAPPTQ